MRRTFFLRCVIGGLGLALAIQLVGGIRYAGGPFEFVLLSLLFGLVSAVLKPILSLLSCPLVLLTLGLFLLVINAFLLQITSSLAQTIDIPFVVVDFGAAFLGGIIISLTGLLANLVISDQQ
ncbi:MAG TPA: phage holin family protein [Anaerolineae bacterium]|nr:phage holin family protein [Anaerolineae bacterium]